jgi:hypothetical protein
MSAQGIGTHKPAHSRRVVSSFKVIQPGFTVPFFPIEVPRADVAAAPAYCLAVAKRQAEGLLARDAGEIRAYSFRPQPVIVMGI